MQLCHDVGTMNFDGAFAYPKFAGDNLVETPRNKRVQNMAFLDG